MSPTSLEVLLRGHLWVESELIAILEEVLPYPKEINIVRLAFPLKVNLTAAHGCIHSGDVPAYLKLNSLRNKAAHNLHDDPNEDAVKDLLQNFGTNLKYLYRDNDGEAFINPGEQLWLGKLRAAISCLCIGLSGEREQLAEHHRQQVENSKRYGETHTAAETRNDFGLAARPASEEGYVIPRCVPVDTRHHACPATALRSAASFTSTASMRASERAKCNAE